MKAIACELPATSGVSLSRWSGGEVAREAMARGLVAEISGTTVWRWLREDALRPFYHRSWIFPRAQDFAEKASRVLDLYEGRWEGESLGEEEYVISADEKTSIQARHRRHPILPSGEDRPMRVSMSTSGRELWPTWPPGMSTGRSSSVVASRRTV